MRTRSRTEYSLLNMITGVGGYVMHTAAGFICRIVFVHTLSAEYLGISGLFSNILSMMSLAELGISSAITFALYQPIAAKDEEKTASIMQFYKKAYQSIGCLLAGIGLLLFPFLSRIVGPAPEIKENLSMLYLLYLLDTVISYFFSYRQSLLLAMQRQYIVTGYQYLVSVLQSAVQILFLLTTGEYLWYLLIQILAGMVCNLWVFQKAAKEYPYITSKKVPRLSKKETRALWKNIKALAVGKTAGVLVNSTDNLAMTWFLGLQSVGLASNYTLFITMADKLITQLFNGLTGSIGNLNASSGEETKYRFFKILNLANYWLYGWAAIGIALVSGDVVQWLYGKEYVLPLQIPMILAANFFTLGMLHAVYTYKSTMGLFRYGQYVLFVTGILNVLLDVLLGKTAGIFGIFCATFLARLVTNVWYEPYVVYRYGFQKPPIWYAGRMFRYVVVLLVTGGICYGLCAGCRFPSGWNVLVKVLLCSLVHHLMCYFCFRDTEEFAYLKESAKRICRKRKAVRESI